MAENKFINGLLDIPYASSKYLVACAELPYIETGKLMISGENEDSLLGGNLTGLRAVALGAGNKLFGTNINGVATKVIAGAGISISDNSSVESVISVGTGINYSHNDIAITGTGWLNGGGAITGNQAIDINSTLITSSVSSGSKIAATDSNGYLNNMVKDFIYIQVIPKGTTISLANAVACIYIPSYLASRPILSMGAGITGTKATTVCTIHLASGTGINGSLGSVALGSNPVANGTGTFGALPTANTKLNLNITALTGTSDGLDFWFEVGR